MVPRTLVLLYALVAYLLFFGVILYAIGFEANEFVPKSIDSGQSALNPILAVAINVSLLALFVVQHTIMARGWFKRWFVRIVPTPVERSTFVLLSGLILILIFWLWQPIGGEVWSVKGSAGRAVLTGISLLGWAMVFLSSFLIDHFELFGMRQAWLYFRGIPYSPPRFVKRSLYNHVRHPLMLGFLIAFWATPNMSWGHLLFTGLITAYVFFGITMEERDLVRAHGLAYENYRRSTPMIIPFPWKRISTVESEGVRE